MVQEMDRAEQVAKKFDEVYSLANKQLTSKIERIFESYRRDHGLTKVEAQRVLDNVKNLTNIRELKQALRNTTDSEEIRQLLILLDSAPYASRIERYERLQQEVGKLSTRLYKAEKRASNEFYGEFISDAYYHSIFDLHQQAGVAFAFNKIDPEEIKAIQHMPWLGANYSQRIWGNTQQLADELQKELAVGLLTGRSSHETADAIDAKFAKGKNNARRLVRTEANHFHAEMEAKAYEEADVEYYRFLATLDLRTSSICREHDGKVYRVSERVKGKNYPPLHPWCRSDTIALDDDEWLTKVTRSARDPETGKTIQVPADMTYDDWYEKYVEKVSDKVYNQDRDYKVADVEIERALQKQSDSSWRKLLGEEQNALQEYTGPFSGQINRYLRNQRFLDDIEMDAYYDIPATVKMLDNALNTNRLGHDLQLFRHIDYSEFIALQQESEFKAYVSTSISEYATDNFGEGYKLVINSPKETKGLYVGEYSTHPSEKEFMVARNTKYRILNVDMDRGVLELELVINE
ncbi:phage head morphogenesis protein [Streptococcus acidominimus]|uniref:Phage head morphogenesis protein n=2 Tax=Streptococcus acidominimus TaxID=1326 RepID=A0A1Q8EFU7_STRAI|nr:phage head morphogenesis protein [Streptococcus acidominimus]SUN05090.1 phage head morphogenesis protein [Streptococcus acidominimus]